MDDAPVRGLRHRRGDQRALPLPARPRPDRALDGVRHAVADGPRLRPPALARRGRARGRRGRHARRHADAVPGDRPRRRQRLDDDQRARRRSCSPTTSSRPRSRAFRRPALAGTIQADILKEYIAQKEWCFPIDPAMRLLGDMIEWCSREMPRWHPVSISGYHIREAGSTAAQELAFTLKDGLTYVEQAVARGLDVDDFAPRLSFFFNAQIDFFEEIGKYRAARRIWARELRETFGAKDQRSLADALPHADRRRQPDRAAAAQQHHAHGDRGARRRARRHAVAAHQQLRRGARAADRGRGADRAAHAADHRPRDRRREHDRPARRQLLRRGADRRARAPGLRLLPPHRRARRHGRGGQAELPAARDRRRQLRAAAGDRRRPAHRRRRQRVHRRGDDDQTPTLKIDPALERKQIGRLQAVRARRDGAAVEAALERAARGRGRRART